MQYISLFFTFLLFIFVNSVFLDKIENNLLFIISLNKLLSLKYFFFLISAAVYNCFSSTKKIKNKKEEVSHRQGR